MDIMNNPELQKNIKDTKDAIEQRLSDKQKEAGKAFLKEAEHAVAEKLSRLQSHYANLGQGHDVDVAKDVVKDIIKTKAEYNSLKQKNKRTITKCFRITR